MTERSIEWGPIDASEWELNCEDGAIEVQGIRNGCCQVYRDADPELFDPQRPWHWFVDYVPDFTCEESNSGLCATEEEAKRCALESATRMGLLPLPSVPARELDDQTLDLFGGAHV